MTLKKKIRKKLLAAHRKLREVRMIAKGLASTEHPLLVHIIPIRRCNLACTYCNEFDDFSKPVPIEEMFRRIDRLGAMGTSIDHDQRRRAAAASGSRRDHRAHPQERNPRRADHQRISACWRSASSG